MKKILILVTLALINVFYSHLAIAMEPAVVLIRHSHEGACDWTETIEAYAIKSRGKCLTSIGIRHADLYNQNLDTFLIKQNKNPITKVIVIDPYTLVQPENTNYPTTNPYWTIFPYLDTREATIKPEIVISGPKMNTEVVGFLKNYYFNEKNTGSTLIVWESKKLDTDVLGTNTALLKLLIKTSDISKLPTWEGKITTTRDTLYLLTNGQLDGDGVKYNVQVFYDYFTTDGLTFKRNTDGDMTKIPGASDPKTITDMIFCPFQGQQCDINCSCN